MTQNFPDDEIGGALQIFVEIGFDLTRPIDIDFHIICKNKEAAEEIERASWFFLLRIWITGVGAGGRFVGSLLSYLFLQNAALRVDPRNYGGETNIFVPGGRSSAVIGPTIFAG